MLNIKNVINKGLGKIELKTAIVDRYTNQEYLYEWECEKCGHKITSNSKSKPEPIKIKAGHICEFKFKSKQKM